ncbi:DEAD/DEAH box helicase family protein [Hyphomonas sp.]|uniref:DEAD/DEAH box helicase n=1 Tax=Hyphomonas sp. TaxID=87 RepID=UPI0030F62187
MMRTLDYQARVLEALDAYLEALKEAKLHADRIAAALVGIDDSGAIAQDFAESAWDKIKKAGKLPKSRASIPFSSRHDGCDRAVPNITLKVPTGGGKTYLAAHGVSRILGRYLSRDRGFVLWIVPNEAIYTQTLKTLKDRGHPYRQTLDRAAAGRVRILEKTDRLDARDVEANLCVMVLMLASANRQTKDTLKMFQDRGDVHGFTPNESEQAAHAALLKSTPNLSVYDLADGTASWPMVKDSLGNALRIIRPIVIMDEGQKAVSELAYETLYGLNPVLVLELSATPKDVKERTGKNPRPAKYANLLVEVTGKELDDEGMIKMPLNLDPRQGTDWKATLNAGVERLNALQATATTFQSDSNRYIRPIMLVQVEATGADQRGNDRIHAEDAKDWLLTAGFDEAEIAIKTAETNDLSQPENLDLLSPTNRVRVIITMQALQEGWDCPFAYVLCSLAARSNQNAMTQLVGRILRQPGALKTGVDALDECYVVTHHASTGDVVKAIKGGLEKDGLGDLVLSVSTSDGEATATGTRKVTRRKEFNASRIYLPLVLQTEGEALRNFDYETDLLSAIDWRNFDPSGIAANIPENAQAAVSQLQRIRLADDGEPIIGEQVGDGAAVTDFDPTYAVRMVSDLVPNPFVGRVVVERLLAALKGRGFSDDKINGLGGLIIDELRKGLEKERDARAEALFKANVTKGDIQFRLRVDGRNWKMPQTVETNEPLNGRQLVRDDGSPIQLSLFAPVYEYELNKDERDVAIYLDKDEALNWWHRNVARTQYGLPGWKRGRVYPDFVFAAIRKDGTKRLTVLETKGDQLDNLDTAYKRALLELLSDNFEWDTTTPAGALEVITAQGETVECKLILMSEWKTALPKHLS